MAFTTQTFLFIFFPLCMSAYFLSLWLESEKFLHGILKKIRLNDLALIGINACFYLWAVFADFFRFAVYIFVVFSLGIIIQHVRGKNLYLVAEKQPHKSDEGEKKLISLAAPVFFIAVALVVYILVHYKYTGLVANVWNLLFNDTLRGKAILAPLGISFITFSAISYLTDIYTGKAGAGDIIDCTLYLSFFPKVVSGPIVLWRDFKSQIADRKISLSLISNGVSRIMIGFAKKLILADTFGNCIASASYTVDVPSAWGIALLYMLQIYYDFSGYSDIAIGISNILGFSIKENFNFPYLSCSITEFWRRWHISLGTWFREYVYIPLGGNRHGTKRAIINIAIVFILTGIWHGAGWTYMLWGIINGTCNIAEKLISDKKWYRRTPKFIKWFSTMGITFFCWVLFRSTSFSNCMDWMRIMLGRITFEHIPYSWQYYFDARMIFLVAIAVAGATLFGLPKVQSTYNRFIQKTYGYTIYMIFSFILFILSIMFMINSTYSPFIYFQY